MTAHRKFQAIQNAKDEWVIYHQHSPNSMRWPLLVASDVLTDPEVVMPAVAEILNEHWRSD